MASNNKKGYFDKATLTMKFGGALSRPENIFVAKAVKAPDYQYKYKERESLGNGWYGSTEIVTKTNDCTYFIIKDDVVIGWVVSPYESTIHTDLLRLSDLKVKEHIDFLASLTHKKGVVTYN